MRLEFELQEDEYREAVRDLNRRGVDWYTPLRLVGCVAAAAGVALLLGADRNTCLAPILLILIGLLIPIYPLFYGKTAKRRGWQSFVEAGRTILLFSNEAIVVETYFVSARYTSYAFSELVETRRLFLLKRKAGASPLIVPKRACGDAGAVTLLRSFLGAMLTTSAPAFAVKFPIDKASVSSHGQGKTNSSR